MSPRYAIYFAPDPASRLWRFGSEVLGYDAVSGQDVAAFVPPGHTPEGWARATADPRRYGFHATLKAPFRLREGTNAAGLAESLRHFCADTAAVDLGACPVAVAPSSSGGGFVAMMPVAALPGVAALERAVVETFEPYRASLDPAERERRNPDALTPRQRDHLDRYGYPYVLDDFQLHLTLTGRLDEPAPVSRLLAGRARDLGVPYQLALDRLALFSQDSPAARFRIVESVPLRG